MLLLRENRITHRIRIDVGGGGGLLVLEVSGPPLFRFSTSTTHATSDPDLTITARLISLFGEADWTAEAFNATTGGTSLGAVTLTGTGNARLLTAAAFVAPGTLGSVKRVDITATLGSATDTLSASSSSTSASDTASTSDSS